MRENKEFGEWARKRHSWFMKVLDSSQKEIGDVYQKYGKDLVVKGKIDHEAMNKEIDAIYKRHGLK